MIHFSHTDLADAFIQSDLVCIQIIIFLVHACLGVEPQIAQQTHIEL